MRTDQVYIRTPYEDRSGAHQDTIGGQVRWTHQDIIVGRVRRTIGGYVQVRRTSRHLVGNRI